MMEEGSVTSAESRTAHRRARRRRVRRNRAIALVAVLVVAGAIAAIVLLAGHGSGSAAGGSPASTSQAGGSSGASSSPAASLAAAASQTGGSPPASPVASPSPSSVPASSPSSPPLSRPTRTDPLRVYFGGDSLAGMPGVMLQQLGAKNGLADVRTDYVVSSRLTSTDPVDWPAHLRQKMSTGKADVGVFMIGGNDTGMPMLVGGDFTMYPDKKWLEEYRRRAKKIATTMLHSGVQRVYWVGMPIMPSASESKKMRGLNELFAAVAASSPDIVYVDSYDLLAKKNGDFNAALRSGDGVHYTDEGARVVAEAVWEAIRRDWQAQ